MLQMQNLSRRCSLKIEKLSWKNHGNIFCIFCGNPGVGPLASRQTGRIYIGGLCSVLEECNIHIGLRIISFAFAHFSREKG